MDIAVPTYETEITRTVWDNKHGSMIVVKPDGDSLGLVEVTSDGRTIIMPPALARLVAEAIVAVADDLTPIEVGASA